MTHEELLNMIFANQCSETINNNTQVRVEIKLCCVRFEIIAHYIHNECDTCMSEHITCGYAPINHECEYKFEIDKVMRFVGTDPEKEIPYQEYP